MFGGKSISDLSIEENQQRYITPFVIWANYDIEEQYIDKISANYLSSLVLETAGLEMTPYNKYLTSLYEELPVINAVGYIDKNGTYYDYKDDSQYSSMLEDYKILQYNNMFDKTDKPVSYTHLGALLHPLYPVTLGEKVVEQFACRRIAGFLQVGAVLFNGD